MSRIRLHASPHGTPGEVVAVEKGQIVWTGPIGYLAEAGDFDELFCHDDDEERLASLASGVETIETTSPPKRPIPG
jgi:hypothetical protein